MQLSSALATVTFVLVIGVESLLGLGPALVLGASGLTALPAGRAMDRFGRVPVLAAGYVLGTAGVLLAAAGAWRDAPPAVVAGFLLVGAAAGVSLLTRTAAGDMYPSHRRGRGIAFVLFGSVFGAILGPIVFGPLLADRELGGDSVALVWAAAAGFTLTGLVLVLAVRPDPRRIAEMLSTRRPDEEPQAAAPLRVILRRPGVVPALLAALASFAVMVAVMNLTGFVVVEHGHHAHLVFPIVGAHVLGMYALVVVVGAIIDRVGRTPALVGGLALMGASVLSLLWVTGVAATAVALFVLGLGWNFSFVAATAELADAAGSGERGKLLGFNDLLSALTGASLALLGGFGLSRVGVAAVAVGGTVLVVAPALWILLHSVVGGRVVRPSSV